MPKLLGKNVLVTGATSGIGKAIAIRFAQDGANVAINYLDDKSATEEVQKIVDKERSAAGKDGKSMIVQADVSKEDQVARMFTEVIGQFGSLDILVNNAVESSSTTPASTKLFPNPSTCRIQSARAAWKTSPKPWLWNTPAAASA